VQSFSSRLSTALWSNRSQSRSRVAVEDLLPVRIVGSLVKARLSEFRTSTSTSSVLSAKVCNIQIIPLSFTPLSNASKPYKPELSI